MNSPLPPSGAPIAHFVSKDPFDPYERDEVTAGMKRAEQASQLQLTWWRFKKHKLALYSGIFLLVLYLMIVVVEFLAPYNLHTRNVDFIHAPPQGIHLFDDKGNFVGPFCLWSQDGARYGNASTCLCRRSQRYPVNQIFLPRR